MKRRAVSIVAKQMANKRAKYNDAAVSIPSSSQYVGVAPKSRGTRIHAAWENAYERVESVDAISRVDEAALKVVNLYTKLRQLEQRAAVYELPLELPWAWIGGRDTGVLAGVIDAVEDDRKPPPYDGDTSAYKARNGWRIVELKTHNTLDLTRTATRQEHRVQALLYAKMLTVFPDRVAELECIYAPETIRHEPVSDRVRMICRETLHGAETLDAAWKRLVQYVRLVKRPVTTCYVRHLSQPRTIMALTTGAKSVKCVEQRVRLALTAITARVSGVPKMRSLQQRLASYRGTARRNGKRLVHD